MQTRIVKLPLLASLGFLFCGIPALAQSSAVATTNQIAQLQSQIANAQMSADNCWMLVSAALVLLMTGPGLALFYGGLVRRKNVLSIMMQSFAMMCIITVVWAFIGYSLAFSSGTPFIGGLHYAFLHGVGLKPNPAYGPTVPAQTQMIYELMFAIITPAVITGAFAERMKFSAMAVFLTLWSIVVYSPLAHMVWGQGGFLSPMLGGTFPCLDFAGGTVVEIASGVSALMCALYLGKRTGYPREPMPPHSVVLSFTGACLLWVGWLGFNAGSAFSAGSVATSAFVNTQFAAAAAAILWATAEWIHRGKPSALGTISGAVAGLVAITPAAGFVQPMPALLIGAVAGIVCYFMVVKVKLWFGYDDSLDAFGIHGIGGTIGVMLTGVFASSLINPIFRNAKGALLPSGGIEGNWHQLLNQLVGVVIAWGLSMVGTLILLKLVDMTIGLRVSPEHEDEGLDITQHGEEGYDFAS